MNYCNDIALPLGEHEDRDLSGAAGQLELYSTAAVLCDLQQRDAPIVAANQAFTRLTGYSANEAIGRNCRFLSNGKLAKSESKAFRKAISAGQSLIMEVRNFKRSGAEFRNGVTLVPFCDPNDVPLGILGLLVDMTEFDPTRVEQVWYRATKDLAGLTDRQREVAQLVALGRSDRDVATELGILPRAAKQHRKLVLAKLKVRTAGEVGTIVSNAQRHPWFAESGALSRSA